MKHEIAPAVNRPRQAPVHTVIVQRHHLLRPVTVPTRVPVRPHQHRLRCVKQPIPHPSLSSLPQPPYLLHQANTTKKEREKKEKTEKRLYLVIYTQLLCVLVPMDGSANPKNNPAVKVAEEPEEQAASLPKLFLVASIAAGIQFGWALQLSLLTPYVQLLGIPHKYASLIWLCGPISGMIVQPLVGYNSDKCTSRFGRRRPFIVGGAFLVVAAVVLIGFAADIGRAAGDPLKVPRARAIACFVVGFWILDVANNMLQGPCRAFLADLSAGSVRKTRTANAYFSLFMAVGNVLGYAAGSYTHLYRMFPFTKTSACDIYCANLKSCFFLSIALLASVTTVALVIVPEKPFTPPEDSDKSESRYAVLGFLRDLQTAIKELPRPMIFLLVVTFLNWVAWFPFLLFDTDWMGKEVFGGTVGEGKLYDRGVRAGALGLMINSVVLGFSSVGTDYLARKLGGVKKLWGFANFLLALCLAFTVLVTRLAESSRRFTAAPGGGTMPLPPSMGVKVGAWTLFAVLGIPLSVTYSIPFALASIYSSSSGKGQGLSLGVLNLAIVIPQMIVSILAGPWDDLFGGGNIPAFVVGAIAAALSGIVALTMLPSPPPDVPTSKLLSVAGGGH